MHQLISTSGGDKHAYHCSNSDFKFEIDSCIYERSPVDDGSGINGREIL